MAVISDRVMAGRLARAIAADIQLYNGDRVDGVTDGRRQMELLAEEIEEGRELFTQRVSPEIGRSDLYDQVMAEAFGVNVEGNEEPVPGPASTAPPQPAPPLRFAEPAPGSEPGEVYRQAQVRPLCVTCREVASAACARCRKPFCGDHAPPRWKRCETCEGEYLRRGKTWGVASWKTILLLLGSIAGAVVALALAAFDERAIFGLLATALIGWSVALPFTIDRLLFLGERRR